MLPDMEFGGRYAVNILGPSPFCWAKLCWGEDSDHTGQARDPKADAPVRFYRICLSAPQNSRRGVAGNSCFFGHAQV
jgi:hypothetical protein